MFSIKARNADTLQTANKPDDKFNGGKKPLFLDIEFEIPRSDYRMRESNKLSNQNYIIKSGIIKYESMLELAIETIKWCFVYNSIIFS